MGLLAIAYGQTAWTFAGSGSTSGFGSVDFDLQATRTISHQRIAVPYCTEAAPRVHVVLVSLNDGLSTALGSRTTPASALVSIRM